MECECDRDPDFCDIHVDCDVRCMALKNPITSEDYKKSFEHYKEHEFMYGCSHGR